MFPSWDYCRFYKLHESLYILWNSVREAWLHSNCRKLLKLFHNLWILKSHANNVTASFILQRVYDFFAGSPTSSRGSSATSSSHVCWHVRLFLQLLTGTQVTIRQNNNFFFCPASMYFSVWLAFINKAYNFLPQIQRNSSEAYRSHCKNNMAEISKSFQKFAGVLLSKILQRFAFKKLSNIFQLFAFKNFHAICFQKVSSDLLSKFCQLFSFQKAFKNFSSD